MGGNGHDPQDVLARNRFLNSRLAAGRGFLEEGNFKAAAQAFLIEAEFTTDTITRNQRIEVAKVCASISLSDAIEEASATLKDTWKRQLREVA